MFSEEFQTLIQVKKSIIMKAIENGVSRSSTLQVQTNRVDAKVEEAILQLQHLNQTFNHFAKAQEDAVASATPVPGGAEAPAEAPAETPEREPLVFPGGPANG